MKFRNKKKSIKTKFDFELQRNLKTGELKLKINENLDKDHLRKNAGDNQSVLSYAEGAIGYVNSQKISTEYRKNLRDMKDLTENDKMEIELNKECSNMRDQILKKYNGIKDLFNQFDVRRSCNKDKDILDNNSQQEFESKKKMLHEMGARYKHNKYINHS